MGHEQNSAKTFDSYLQDASYAEAAIRRKTTAKSVGRT